MPMDRSNHATLDDRTGTPTAGADAVRADAAPGPGGTAGEQPRAEAPDKRTTADAPERNGAGPDAARPDAGEDGPTAGRPRKRRRRLLIFLLICAVLIAGGAAYYYFFYANGVESTDDAFIDGDIVRISPQVAGELIAVPVTNNASVTPGDILAEIDPGGPQAQLALKKAQLAEAQAAVGQAKAQIEQAQSDVAQKKSALKGAKVQAENARTQADRLKQLSDKARNSAISQQQLDNAESQARQAEASYEEAQTAVSNAQAGVSAAQASLQSARAQVKAAEAAVADAQVTVDRLTVKAPIAGQVVQKNVNVGSYVQPGSQMMAIVPKDLYVTANFKETQLFDIRVGQAVDIAVDAFPDVSFKGTVRSIQHGAGQAFQLLPPQNATGNFVKVVQRVPVRISIDSPDPSQFPLGPGMSVVPTVHTD